MGGMGGGRSRMLELVARPVRMQRGTSCVDTRQSHQREPTHLVFSLSLVRPLKTTSLPSHPPSFPPFLSPALRLFHCTPHEVLFFHSIVHLGLLRCTHSILCTSFLLTNKAADLLCRAILDYSPRVFDTHCSLNTRQTPYFPHTSPLSGSQHNLEQCSPVVKTDFFSWRSLTSSSFLQINTHISRDHHYQQDVRHKTHSQHNLGERCISILLPASRPFSALALSPQLT